MTCDNNNNNKKKERKKPKGMPAAESQPHKTYVCSNTLHTGGIFAGALGLFLLVLAFTMYRVHESVTHHAVLVSATLGVVLLLGWVVARQCAVRYEESTAAIAQPSTKPEPQKPEAAAAAPTNKAAAP
jgi:hypothetical protein